MATKSVSRPAVSGGTFSVRDTLFLLSLDLRTSWDEPDSPRRIAAWRAWHALRRAESEILPLVEAIGATDEPPILTFDDHA